MLFQITNRCYMNCPHCFVNAQPDSPHAHSSVIENFIQFVYEYDILKIGIAGGEPTEYPNFYNVFLNVLKQCKKSLVILMTNGLFLLEKEKVELLAALSRQYPFMIQVTSIPGLYPQYNQVKAAYQNCRHLFPSQQIGLVEKLTVLETNLGRAKGYSWDMPGLDERKASMCCNAHLVARQTHSFKEFLYVMDKKSNLYCSPMVDIYGNIYAGETPSCVPMGNIGNPPDEIFQNFRTKEPCGKCGSGNKGFMKSMLKRVGG